MKFERVPETTTGITVKNPYDDASMWGDRYRAFMGGGMGSGLAVGDFDRDGKPDLFVSTKTRAGRLYRNLGQWKFEDSTTAAGLAEEPSSSWFGKSDAPVWRQGAVFADVNNDGWPDLYVCRNRAPNLLYINQGNGTFIEEGKSRGLDLVDGSVIGAFCDYDRDGWLDVLVVTNQMDGNETEGRADRLFHNLGNGTFKEVTETSGLHSVSFGHSASWFDYNRDGWPDVYIANDFSGGDHFFRNNGNGTFTEITLSAVPHTPYSSMGSDSADLNNDGWIDLFVADMATTSRIKDRRGLAASRNDVVSASTRENSTPQTTRNTLFLNTGTGRFREIACQLGIDATDWTWSVRFEDFDNDGWQDLHVTNGMIREANNLDVLSSMMRALSDAERIQVMKASAPLNEANLAYRNLKGEYFEPVAAAWGLNEVGISFGAATADFDADGDLDLVHINCDGGVSVYRNDTSGHHRIQVRLQGVHSNRDGIGARLTLTNQEGVQVRELVSARGYASGSELVAQFGLGLSAASCALVIDWPSGKRDAFSDLQVDRAYLVREGDSTGSVAPAPAPPLYQPAERPHPLLVRDASRPALPDKEQALLPFRTDRGGPGLAVGDVNNDGFDDIYQTSTTGSGNHFWLGSDSGYIPASPPVLAAVGTEEGPAAFLDANHDGLLDLLTTRASANSSLWPEGFTPRIYIGDGRGGWRGSGYLDRFSANVGALALADVNKDGRIDLFIAGRSIPGKYPAPPRSLLLLNRADGFQDVSETLPQGGELGLIRSACFCDLDGDGLSELVLATEWNLVRVLSQKPEGSWRDETEERGFTSGGRGWWTSLAIADFNQDGRPDIVAGNWGTNSPYRANQNTAPVLFAGDFARNGTNLLMEGVREAGVLIPSRSRSDLGARMPQVLRKFRRNDDFAKATMQELVGADALGAAVQLEADNLRSRIFLSQNNGRYQATDLPFDVQTSPVTGLLARDLNGDGLTDLVCLQNLDTSIPRMEGGTGVLLAGDGHGGFTALTPLASGFHVSGFGRALVEIDANGDQRPDLLVTRQGGENVLFLHREDGLNWFEVRGSETNSSPRGFSYLDDGGVSRKGWIGDGGGWWSAAPPVVRLASPSKHVPKVLRFQSPPRLEVEIALDPTHKRFVLPK